MDDDRLARLLAYIDGELAPEDRRAFEAQMAAEPRLAEEVEAHRDLSGRLAAAYAPVLEEPVPLSLALAASAANDRGRRFGLPQWAAVAASLVVGLVVGRAFLTPEGSLAETPHGLAARGELADGLTTRLAAGQGPIRVGLTFRDAEGRFCRTFQSAPDRLAGVACRDDGEWRLHATVRWTPESGPEYRTAGSDIPPAVLAAVDGLRVGEPLDAAQERAARDRGWR